MTFYVSNSPKFPNMYIMSPGLETRFIPWFTESLKLEGMPRWNFTNWTDEPWTRASYNYPSWNAGEMFFVYPGKRGQPILSLRYKWLEKGIRDYERMQQLKQLGHEQAVNQAMQKVMRQSDLSMILQCKSGEEIYSTEESDYNSLLDVLD